MLFTDLINKINNKLFLIILKIYLKIVIIKLKKMMDNEIDKSKNLPNKANDDG